MVRKYLLVLNKNIEVIVEVWDGKVSHLQDGAVLLLNLSIFILLTIQPCEDRVPARLNVLFLQGLILNLRAEAKVVFEEVVGHVLVFKVVDLRSKVRVNVELNLSPAEVGLVEGVNHPVAVQSVVGLAEAAVVHRCLHHVESKLPVLLQLKVLVSCLLEKQSHDQWSALDHVGYSEVVVGGELYLANDLEELSNNDRVFCQQMALVGLVEHGVGFFHLGFDGRKIHLLLRVDRALLQLLSELGHQLDF